MSYTELSERLLKVAKSLAENGEKLEGIPLSKAAAALGKSLGSFETKLSDFLGGQGPGIRELQDLLKSPAAKKHLSLPALKIIFRNLLSKTLREETPAKAKALLFKEVKNAATGEEAVAHLKDFFRHAAAPAALELDKASLQQEFLRLGSLDSEELDYELAHRFKAIGTLKKLAKANAITFSPKTSRERLIQEITHYAQRAHRNVGSI